MSLNYEVLITFIKEYQPYFGQFVQHIAFFRLTLAYIAVQRIQLIKINDDIFNPLEV
jgi:hypothetical protein